LPAMMKENLSQRLWDILTGKDTSPDFEHLSAPTFSTSSPGANHSGAFPCRFLPSGSAHLSMQLTSVSHIGFVKRKSFSPFQTHATIFTWMCSYGGVAVKASRAQFQ
jgi:hypothetical protein